MKRWKKSIAFLIMNCLVFTAMPMQAFAMPEEPVVEVQTEVPELLHTEEATQADIVTEESLSEATTEVVQQVEEATEETFQEVEVTEEEIEDVEETMPENEINAQDVAEDENNIYGQCGKDVSWEYIKSTGDLIIYGNGPMYDYDMHIRPWEDFKQDIKEITIYKISSIGNYAFYALRNVSKVTIESTVETVGEGAFKGCDSLTTITVPESVQSIGEYAFFDCRNLKRASILSPKLQIGKEAFGYYYDVDLSALGRVDDMALRGYLGTQTEFYAKENNVTFMPLGQQETLSGQCGKNIFWEYKKENATLYINGTGAMYDYNEDYNYSFSKGDITPWTHLKPQVKEIVVSSGVTSIGDGTFMNMSELTNVNLPSSVQEIGKSVFFRCYALEKINLPENLSKIGDQTFQMCYELKDITLPNNLKEIGEYAFGSCVSLTKISLPNHLTKIGRYAVDNCKGITEIDWPKSLSVVPEGVFSCCKKLKKVTLPEGVTKIDTRAFYNCPVLCEITIPKSVTRIGEYVFDGDESFVAFPNKDLVIKGYAGTFAESYAKRNQIAFYDLSRKINIARETVSITSATLGINSITIQWSQAKSADAYKLYRSVSGGKYSLIKSFKATDARKYVDKSVSSGKGYTYKVIGSFDGVNSKTVAKLICYIGAPTITLKNTTTGVLISWKKVTGANGYYICRKTETEPYRKISTVKASVLSYTDKTALSGKKYTYAVKAYVSKPSTVSAYESKNILYLKVAKLTLLRTRKLPTIHLKWTKVAGASGYYIYRKTKTGSYTKIATIKKGTTVQYTDKTAKKGVTYTYAVRAYSGNYTSSYIGKSK